MQGIAGKVAIVTGGSAGIGRATAVAFAAQGAKVVVASRREQESQETLDLIRAAGSEGIFVQTDVALAGDVESLINTTFETYGRIDILVNNAGVAGDNMFIAEMSEANWDRVIDTNLKGVWLGMKYAIPHMLRQGSGAVVNVSSALGLIGSANASPYVAAKHGVIGLTKSVALEYAKSGIRVNAVCPGGVLTDMLDTEFTRQPGVMDYVVGLHPIGRLGTVEEVASSILWLCSEQAGFITGTSLAVDGGWTAY
jgi:NAD(P)-dependent dehydrogenase (short-subunit alcohol dehydrogenase family)